MLTPATVSFTEPFRCILIRKSGSSFFIISILSLIPIVMSVSLVIKTFASFFRNATSSCFAMRSVYFFSEIIARTIPNLFDDREILVGSELTHQQKFMLTYAINIYLFLGVAVMWKMIIMVKKTSWNYFEIPMVVKMLISVHNMQNDSREMIRNEYNDKLKEKKMTE